MRKTNGLVKKMILVAVIALGMQCVASISRADSADEISLETALGDLAARTGLQLAFRTDVTRGLRVKPAPSGLAPEDELRVLLEGTGLEAEKINEHTITIRRADRKTAEQGSVNLTVAQREAAEASQPGAADASAQGVPQSGEKLEEVVVTAQRREEGANKVPMSITALSQQTMDELHIQSFRDLASVIPGLVLTAPGNLNPAISEITLRGIVGGGAAATTAVYIDETPIQIRENYSGGFEGTPQPQVFDLERVEVLRGPQGTLFGSSAMGGAIRFITPQPSPEGASGYTKAEIRYTERGAPGYDLGLAYGAPVVRDKVGFRLSGKFSSDGGFIDILDPFTGNLISRDANSATSYVVRPAFTVVPREGLTITPSVFLQHSHSDHYDQYWLGASDRQGASYVSGTDALGPEPHTDDLKIFNIAIKYEFGGLSLQSDTSYTHRDENSLNNTFGFPQLLLGLPLIDPRLAAFHPYIQNIGWTRAWQQEFRLSSKTPGARLNWIAGAYYRHAVDDTVQFLGPNLDPVTELAFGLTSPEIFGVPDFTLNGQAYSAYAFTSALTEEKALFGEVSFNLTPYLKASMGARIERSALKDQHEVFAGPLQGTTYSSVDLPNQAQTPITPRLSLTYQYTDRDMIYATAAKGFRAGGSNTPFGNIATCQPSLADLGLTAVPPTYGSDSLWSYEVGAKNSLFNERMLLQASVYYIDWSDIQSLQVLPSCIQAFTTNFGKAVSEGLDLQFAAVLMDGLKIGGNVGYDKAFYPDTTYGAPVNGVRPLLIVAGDKLPIAPWSASAHMEYSREVGRVWSQARAYFRTDYRWVDRYPRGDPRLPGYDALYGTHPDQAYGIMNLDLGVTHKDLDLSIFINNLTNSHPLLSFANLGDAQHQLFTAGPLRPRTLGLTASYRF